MQGKVALVTGGGSGIGRGTSLLFAQAGAAVVVADVNGEAARRTVEEIAQTGGTASAFTVDVADAKACKEMVAFVRSQHGRLDYAYNNAGITEATLTKGAPIPATHELPVEIWDRVLAVDLDGVFFSILAELPLMLESGGGAIVNTASLQGFIGFPRTAPYTAAKHGVVGVTKAIAKEYGGQGIRCNAVAPGVIETPLNDQVIHLPEYKGMLMSQIPTQRYGEPADIGRAVLWLCSDAASYVNGTTLAVDGGYLA
ncbi:SDR family oxidoreductase [Sphingobium aromaticivastans]|uniref:SDR family NAD(P)-dependent oxidoreductase n=1 Tax=Sphingobium aromaticivastans TaxID=1778665 RepID=UPI00301ACDB4